LTSSLLFSIALENRVGLKCFHFNLRYLKRFVAATIRCKHSVCYILGCLDKIYLIKISLYEVFKVQISFRATALMH